ncbi:Endonuclease V [Halopenitus malekzadehii]|uniref:Endonuclease V n=1 Tax=Halopenitus malekzadehii TaxID=1267564 RepID=A0A1H6HU65_9EURY|nr:endonuclease V [Halopenitus malekzadehii]SEH37680.1 Endonuclease V [Halopenitus malekzadehii]
MEDLQREIAAAAVFTDDLPDGFGGSAVPDSIAIDEATDLTDGVPEPGHDTVQERFGSATGSCTSSPSFTSTSSSTSSSDPPIVVGIDQAFLEDAVVSAVVAFRGGRLVERTHAVSPLSIPYIPGLLAFREGGPILDALATLSVDPDLAVLDGSGRIHFRQAGIATHIGVVLDLPSVGVAKSLLCGTPDTDVDGRPEGWSTPIRADGRVEAPAGRTDAVDGTVIGHAFQSRQYPNSRRVNPLYVSPGHRVSAATTVDIVDALCAGYKLPEPTRVADAYADAVKRTIVDS